MAWKYEPRTQQGRLPKHNWNKPEAGFETDRDGKHVGMCPSNMPASVAEKLLNNGIEDWPENWERSYPRAIYNIYGGVAYKALPTNPGVSYHGFPCKGPASYPKKSDMSVKMKHKILERARTEGCETEIIHWFDLNP